MFHDQLKPKEPLDPQMQEIADALHINPNSPDGRYISDEDRIKVMETSAAYYEMFGRPLYRTLDEIPHKRTNLVTGKVIQDTLVK